MSDDTARRSDGWSLEAYERLVGIEPDVFEATKLWLDKRIEFASRPPACVCTLKGRPINPQYVARIAPPERVARVEARFHA